MKELLILTGKVGQKKRGLADYLGRSFAGRAKVTVGLFADLVFEIDGQKIEVRLNQKKITDFDLVVFRGVGSDFLTVAGDLALCLKHLEIEYTDTVFKEIGPFGSKMTALIKLSLAGLPMMPSFYCQQDKIRKHMDEIVGKFGFPLIAKELSSQAGRGVFLVKDKKDFDFLDRVKPEEQFLFQDFYQDNEEYRLLVLGYEPRVFYQKIKTDPDEFRANTALGAEEKYLTVARAPTKMREMATKAVRVLGYEIAGADFLVEKKTGKIWILEVNRGPGLTYDIRISPEVPALTAFLAEKLGLPAGRQAWKNDY
jgi:D-alanine-D-alanine ligase-like ATP-grasp enzyme